MKVEAQRPNSSTNGGWLLRYLQVFDLKNGRVWSNRSIEHLLPIQTLVGWFISKVLVKCERKEKLEWINLCPRLFTNHACSPAGVFQRSWKQSALEKCEYNFFIHKFIRLGKRCHRNPAPGGVSKRVQKHPAPTGRRNQTRRRCPETKQN